MRLRHSDQVYDENGNRILKMAAINLKMSDEIFATVLFNYFIPFLLILSFIFSGCTKPKPSLNGWWAVVVDDSLYYEIGIKDSIYWIYSPGEGDFTGKIIKNGDSLQFFNRFNDQFMNRKITWLTDNEFLGSDFYHLERFSIEEHQLSHHYRIDLQMDLMPLIRGDSNAFRNYYSGFYERREKWENGKQNLNSR